MSNKISILVVDDEPQIRKLLEISLESSDYKVLQAATSKQGLVLAANYQPELILLDLGLPDEYGQETLKHLRTWYTKPIIILSVQNNETDIITALDNGATDYLTKPFRTGELLARIRSALRHNQTDNNNPVVVCAELEVDFSARIVRKKGQIVKLTSTEYNLLALFIKHQGKTLTHQFILKEVWGHSYQSETQYLRVFLASLRKKLEENPNEPRYFITEPGIGYRFQTS